MLKWLMHASRRKPCTYLTSTDAISKKRMAIVHRCIRTPNIVLRAKCTSDHHWYLDPFGLTWIEGILVKSPAE